MPKLTRRQFIQSSAMGGALFALPPSIRKALAIPAHSRTGTIHDVEHVVILMQENRSFDQYFGTYPGVRGFGDRFTIPLPGGRSVWQQSYTDRVIMPYHLDATRGNALRANGTPHEWPDAHEAWDDGRMSKWPVSKTPVSMGYFEEQELPFQRALAKAFTLCDAYHCSMHAGTNPNRLFLWTGTNGPSGANVAAVLNEWDGPGPADQGYRWTTYPERLEAAGVSWKVYQFLPDNFGDNSLAGFPPYREASIRAGNPASPPKGFNAFVPYTDAINAALPLYKGNGNTLPARHHDDLEGMLAGLRKDVRAGRLPQVSWIVAPQAYSEHPDGSSPIQGGWCTQEVLDILTENPEVWAKTVLLVNYDENDGYFDHVPSPSAPSRRPDGTLAGGSTVPFDAELFRHAPPPGSKLQPKPDGGVYGPGPRVPMFVISPWSRGGWVNSQVFDHTSVLQFLERRFGVQEPNISAWRRAVCGDLTSAFDFANPSRSAPPRIRAISRTTVENLRERQESLAQVPVPPVDKQELGLQKRFARPSRALPYRLEVLADVRDTDRAVRLQMANRGAQGAVFHVYDRLRLEEIPRRYTVEAGKSLADVWTGGDNYDLWLLGPNGYHRALKGSLGGAQPELAVAEEGKALWLTLANRSPQPARITIARCPYTEAGPWTLTLQPGETLSRRFDTAASGGWYDLTLEGGGGWMRRLAGRIETGEHSISDPLMGV
jgi:phospholipase C